MSNVYAMYNKMSLSVATPFQTWETPSTGCVTVCCMSNFISPTASQSPFSSICAYQRLVNEDWLALGNMKLDIQHTVTLPFEGVSQA